MNIDVWMGRRRSGDLRWSYFRALPQTHPSETISRFTGQAQTVIATTPVKWPSDFTGLACRHDPGRALRAGGG